jgi:hypothetical protein
MPKPGCSEILSYSHHYLFFWKHWRGWWAHTHKMEPSWDKHHISISMHARQAGPWRTLHSLVHNLGHWRMGLLCWELFSALRMHFIIPSLSLYVRQPNSKGWSLIQGRVLSSLLWSLTVDRPLVSLSMEGLYAQGSSDFLVLLIAGKFPSTVSEFIHLCLSIVLIVHDDKLEPVLFVREKIERFIEPTLSTQCCILLGQLSIYGCPLWPGRSMWISKVWLCDRTLGKIRGHKPKIIHWLFHRHSRAYTYICGNCTGVCITVSMSTVDTAALEVHIGLQAIHLVAEAETSAQLAGIVVYVAGHGTCLDLCLAKGIRSCLSNWSG